MRGPYLRKSGALACAVSIVLTACAATPVSHDRPGQVTTDAARIRHVFVVVLETTKLSRCGTINAAPSAASDARSPRRSASAKVPESPTPEPLEKRRQYARSFMSKRD